MVIPAKEVIALSENAAGLPGVRKSAAVLGQCGRMMINHTHLLTYLPTYLPERAKAHLYGPMYLSIHLPAYLLSILSILGVASNTNLGTLFMGCTRLSIKTTPKMSLKTPLRISKTPSNVAKNAP